MRRVISAVCDYLRRAVAWQVLAPDEIQFAMDTMQNMQICLRDMEVALEVVVALETKIAPEKAEDYDAEIRSAIDIANENHKQLLLAMHKIAALGRRLAEQFGEPVAEWASDYQALVDAKALFNRAPTPMTPNYIKETAQIARAFQQDYHGAVAEMNDTRAYVQAQLPARPSLSQALQPLVDILTASPDRNAEDDEIISLVNNPDITETDMANLREMLVGRYRELNATPGLSYVILKQVELLLAKLLNISCDTPTEGAIRAWIVYLRQTNTDQNPLITEWIRCLEQNISMSNPIQTADALLAYHEEKLLS